MIRTLIIEDEAPAAQRLEKLLIETGMEIEVVDTLDSVESGKAWFLKNDHPDLVMLDIQLADGKGFEIFKDIQTESFIIFTTAYDEYALKAFELNSIDYLLKPVRPERLKQSLEKFKKIKESGIKSGIAMEEIMDFIANKKTNYKKRFVINIGNSIKIVETEDSAYFYSMEKDTYLCNREGKSFPIDFSLDNLEKLLDPEKFFRINRQFIISMGSIDKIHVLSKSRIKVELNPTYKDDVLVSSTKSPEFRKWLNS